MRKGEQTRQQILAVAEGMFCQKGYDETSVQDILDAIHGSKGGFYHHFASKDEVLKTLCAQQAEDAALKCREALADTADPMERLNLALRCFIPLRKETWRFLRMLLPTLNRAEGLPVRVAYQEALSQAFGPLLAAEIDRAHEAGLLYPTVPEPARLVTLLVNACWVDAALQFLQEAEAKQPHDPSALLDILRSYRKAVEVLLDAPWGSIELIRPEEWLALGSDGVN